MRLTAGLHRARRMKGGDLALVCGDARLTWNAFVDRVARLAGAFRELGLREGDRVALLAPNGAATLETIFAALWAGGIAVPVNARFSGPEMAEQMRDAEPALLVLDRAHAGAAPTLAAAAPGLRATLVVGEDGADEVRAEIPDAIPYEEAIARAAPAEDAGRGGEDVACLFYTGGTTGRAKGVMLTHANLWANAAATIVGCGLDERLVHLHSGPLFHLGAASRLFTTTIVAGRHVVLPRFTPEGVLAAVERERVTTLVLVPTMMGMILDDPALARYDLSSLRLVTYGASPIHEATLRRFLERFPGVAFVQSYGMTELSPVCTMLGPADHALDAPRHRLRSAGRPVFSAEVRVVDERDRDRPTGEVGEILVRGPMVMKGYWRRPELTARALRGGWMHTGDAGSLDADGYLTVTDRLKDMIITGGENVYSIEVENALHAHPAVRQCAVIGLPDPRWGERVHAVVVAAEPVSAEALIAHCRGLIAGYKLPRSIDFHDGPLPLSSVNKVDKVGLRARCAEAPARAREEVA